MDFLCVGGMRCGSTSLWSILRMHPQVFLPETKELHYFDRAEEPDATSLAEYCANFDAARPDQVRGEFTPSYLSRAGVAERIATHVPDARIVAVLRDPVARSWSHYWFRVRQGRERLSFEEAIDAEPSRASEPDGWRFAYVAWSRYASDLRRFAALFGWSRLHVVFLEDLTSDTEREISRIARFLGVDPAEIGRAPSLRRTNEMVVPRLRRAYTLCKRAEVGLRGRRGLAHVARRIAVRLAEANQRSGSHPVPARIERVLRSRFAASDDELRAALGRELPWSSAAVAPPPDERADGRTTEVDG